MSDKVHKDEVKTVYISKAGYKAPDFLAGYFDNIPGEKELLAAYADAGNETPLWWTRDTDIPLTRKENRRSTRKAMSIRNSLEKQRKKAEEYNIRFQQILEKQQAEFQKRCEMLNQQIALKQEELDLIEQRNKLEYQNRLLELEAELQRTNLEKEFYRREKQKLEELSNENIATFERQQEWESVLAALDEELQKAKEQSRELKNQTNEKRPKRGLPPINLAIMDNEENLFQGMPLSPIKTESFDFGNNILEVKYLTLMDKDNKKTEIKDITFNIRKKGITGIYSSSERALSIINSSIMRTLPSNIQLIKGEIRYNGESIYELLSDEYRKRIKDEIISSVDIEDAIARSTKKISKTFKTALPKLMPYMDKLGIHKEILNKKGRTLNEIEAKKLAVAISLSKGAPCTILEEPSYGFDEIDRDRLISLFNDADIRNAVLILSSDKYLCVNIRNISLYTFGN